MTNKLPITYHNQNGCYNCKHVFCREEYESEPEYFCTLNEPQRPLCGSVSMKECGSVFKESEDINDLWDDWSSGRLVQSFGSCSFWLKL